MKRLNKKGFTLVELLAVIIILALLIVVTMSTALPAMNNAKKSTFVTYTLRAYQASVQMIMSDYLTTNPPAGGVDYSYEKLLGADKKKYYGDFNVTKTGDAVVDATGSTVTVKAKTALIDVQNKLCIPANSSINDELSASVVKTASYNSCTGYSSGASVTDHASCIDAGGTPLWNC